MLDDFNNGGNGWLIEYCTYSFFSNLLQNSFTKLNKANSSDTEALLLDLDLSITSGIVSSKICDKRDDFNFEIVIFNFLMKTSYGVYISQLIPFARVCSYGGGTNLRHSELIVEHNICLKTLLQQGIAEPVFYGDFVYKELRALRGYFGHPLRLKIKIVFQQVLLISLLEQ